MTTESTEVAKCKQC